MGNAYLSNFFVNMRSMTELKDALKAYNQSVLIKKLEKIFHFIFKKKEKQQVKDNPDLHYNRAQVIK